ncbi:hypothetical protein ABZZ36_31795 [Actinacidiphila glaucinigra]|uniref:hypothetical protein n=1 Tax=Actinacidiphila glaucinigra TaxID=235986 RepID=UPI0033A37523
MDDQVGTALIAAAAALLGGLVTGVFTVLAARKQADAAWAAGQRQADAAWEAGRQQAAAAWDAGQLQATAQLDAVRTTLSSQQLEVQRSVRRSAYVSFLSQSDRARRAWQAWQSALGSSEASTRRREYDETLESVVQSLNVVRLEGPANVTAAAEALQQSLSPNAPGHHHAQAHQTFLSVARAALLHGL